MIGVSNSGPTVRTHRRILRCGVLPSTVDRTSQVPWFDMEIVSEESKYLVDKNGNRDYSLTGINSEELTYHKFKFLNVPQQLLVSILRYSEDFSIEYLGEQESWTED